MAMRCLTVTIHHKNGANRDWELIFAMYRRPLGPV